MADYPWSVRWSEEDMRLLVSLEADTGLGKAEVLRLALRVLRKGMDLLPALAAGAVPEEMKKARRKKSK